MKDKLHWFKFSPGQWMMGRIQKCPEITQARFMNLCCLYWNKECFLSLEDAEIEIDKEHIDILLSKKVIKLNGENINILFLDEQMEGIDETSNKRRRAANVRWQNEKGKKDALAMHLHKDAMQNDADKNRTEKIREDKNKPPIVPPLSEFLDYAKEKLKSDYPSYKSSLILKYEAWMAGGWKTGGDKPRDIKNWKTTLLNTIPHLKKEEQNNNIYHIPAG